MIYSKEKRGLKLVDPDAGIHDLNELYENILFYLTLTYIIALVKSRVFTFPPYKSKLAGGNVGIEEMTFSPAK